MDVHVRPEYRSYVDLMRRLHESGFEWSWNVADAYWLDDPDSEHGGRVGVVFTPVYGEPRPLIPHVVPLPRLEHWVALLRQVGALTVAFSTPAEGGDCAAFCLTLTDVNRGLEVQEIRMAPTAEEAAARLWCALAGLQIE